MASSATGRPGVDNWKMGKDRPARNALLAERTPRRNFIGWDFNPPPAQPVPQRWPEPDQAQSILYMLSSQKEKVAREEQWLRDSQQRIKAFEASQAEANRLRKMQDAQQLAASNAIESSEVIRQTSRLSTSRTDRSDHSQASVSSARSARSKADSSGLSLEDLPASAIRSLQVTHPAVMADYRAKRAAKFLETQHVTDPSAPLPKPQEKRTSFRPAGVLTRHHNADIEANIHGGNTAHNSKSKSNLLHSAGHSSLSQLPIPRSEADLKEELIRLRSALEKTDEEIERQSLKIALSKKVKTYEKRTS